VVADIIDCAKHTVRRRFFEWQPGSEDCVAPANEETVRLYIRAKGTAAQARTLFLGSELLYIAGADPGEVAFVTAPGVEKELTAKLAGLRTEMVLRVAS
jgi:hypothetical protein